MRHLLAKIDFPTQDESLPAMTGGSERAFMRWDPMAFLRMTDVAALSYFESLFLPNIDSEKKPVSLARSKGVHQRMPH